MSVNISRVYKDAASAMAALGDLEAAGLRRERTVVTIDADTRDEDPHPPAAAVGFHRAAVHRAPDGKAGPKARPMAPLLEIMVIIGGAILTAICLVLLAIPGLGAIVFGLIVGGLIQRGMSRDHADSGKIRRGGVLVTAQVREAEWPRYQAVLDRLRPQAPPCPWRGAQTAATADHELR